MRNAEHTRATRETQITVRLNVDGGGTHAIRTGIGFLDHMLETVAVHGAFDLAIDAKGDLHIDQQLYLKDAILGFQSEISHLDRHYVDVGTDRNVIIQPF